MNTRITLAMILIISLFLMSINVATAIDDSNDDICYIRGTSFQCKHLAIATVQDVNADSTLCYVRYKSLSRFYCDDVKGICAYEGKLRSKKTSFRGLCERECDLLRDRANSEIGLPQWCQSILEDRRKPFWKKFFD